MIEINNLSHYVPHGRETYKLKPRVEEHDGISSTHDVEKSNNKVGYNGYYVLYVWYRIVCTNQHTSRSVCM